MPKQIRTEDLGNFWGLPWIVAQEEGLFADEDLEVVFVPRNTDRATGPYLTHDPSKVHSLIHHADFEEEATDVYMACEWGQVRRAQDSGRGGQIVGKHPVVAVMALFAHKDSDITYPQKLRGKPVGVQFHAGSHYAAIQMLEGFLEPGEIEIVHAGRPRERYEAVVRGEVAAAALMEPWISLAEKNGHHKIIETHFVGSEIGAANLDADTYAAYSRALGKAVRLIQRDVAKYVPRILEDLGDYRDQVEPSDVHLARLKYAVPQSYDQSEFQGTYEWMRRWNLIADNSTYTDLVDNRVSIAI